MHAQAALTIREWPRQDLLVAAEHARRIKHLAPVHRAETPRIPYRIVALRSWLRQCAAKLHPTPRSSPHLVTH
jgi:hypothetical protein